MPYTTGRMILAQSQKYDAGDTSWYIGINTTGTFKLLSTGTVDVDVYWGDGDIETVTTNSVDHTYPSAGTYTIGIKINSGDFYPYYNNDAAADELITLGDTPAGWSFGATLLNAFYGSSDLATIGDIDTSSVVIFQEAWRDCTSLTSFPLIDTSSGTNFARTWRGCSLTSFPAIDTSSGTNFAGAWFSCTGLDNVAALGEQYSFPLIDTSLGTSFSQSWYNCVKLQSFPPLDTSKGTNFYQAWRGCNDLTSFPALDVSLGTTFYQAWRDCNKLPVFPPNFFDSWTGTPADDCFLEAWDFCSSLNATSVENILNSIDTSGQSAPASGVDITIDYDGSDISAVLGAGNAVDNLTGYISDVGRGWTVTLNGTLYEKLNP